MGLAPNSWPGRFAQVFDAQLLGGVLRLLQDLPHPNPIPLVFNIPPRVIMVKGDEIVTFATIEWGCLMRCIVMPPAHRSWIRKTL